MTTSTAGTAAKTHYVSNGQLYAWLCEPDVNRLQIQMAMACIAKNVCNMFRGMQAADRDDAEAEATVVLLGAIHKFDCSRSTNPFSFFTSTARNAILRQLRLEKQQAGLKEHYARDHRGAA